MTDVVTEDLDPRIRKIIKELIKWQDTEFDRRGYPVRKFGDELHVTPAICPSEAIDKALDGLREMHKWASTGRLLEASKDNDDLRRECNVGYDD